jgi:hypothetical protein
MDFSSIFGGGSGGGSAGAAPVASSATASNVFGSESNLLTILAVALVFIVAIFALKK